MLRKQVLRLVEDKGALATEISGQGAADLRAGRIVVEDTTLKKGELHSLHGATHYAWGARAEAADYCIKRYTEKGAVVLDPFCGRGSTVLQSTLLGRIGLGSDSNGLASLVSSAKISPVGLDEIVLALHMIPFQRPVEMRLYREHFFPFYHPDTFREISNLRSHLKGKFDRLSNFIRLLALSRLHGHMPGHLSAYSAPQISFSPERQLELNLKRREKPDYRAVAPRLIRRAAQVLQDGIGSEFFENSRHGEVHHADPRRLSWLVNDSVDSVVTALPGPDSGDPYADQWIGMWFADLADGIDSDTTPESDSFEAWLRFYSDSLGEMLRVTRPGGSVSILTGDRQFDSQVVAVDEQLLSVASRLTRAGKCLTLEESLVYPTPVAYGLGHVSAALKGAKTVDSDEGKSDKSAESILPESRVLSFRVVRRGIR